jgi:ribosomal protein S18 acetylase RimI-like enzyme
MIIRAGRSTDIDRVREIERLAGARFREIGMAHVAENEPVDGSVLLEQAEDGRLFVAERGGALAGFAIFSMLDGHGYLEEVGVVPEHAGQGLGAALIDAVDAEATRRGADGVSLSTFRDVPWNAPWYRRLGFEECDPEALGPGHAVQVAQHAANGLDPASRVWMFRPGKRLDRR